MGIHYSYTSLFSPSQSSNFYYPLSLDESFSLSASSRYADGLSSPGVATESCNLGIFSFITYGSPITCSLGVCVDSSSGERLSGVSIVIPGMGVSLGLFGVG